MRRPSLNAPPQPERTTAKFMAATLALLTLLVLALTPMEEPAKPKPRKVAKPEKTYDTLLERVWYENQEEIEKAALAALLGGL